METRTLKQFHYTKWPDVGIPADPQELVNFISLVNEQIPKQDGPQGPLVIHCRYCIDIVQLLHTVIKGRIHRRLLIKNVETPDRSKIGFITQFVTVCCYAFSSFLPK